MTDRARSTTVDEPADADPDRVPGPDDHGADDAPAGAPEETQTSRRPERDADRQAARVTAAFDAVTRWTPRLVAAAFGVWLLLRLVGLAVHVEVTRWWFRSVDASSVYATELRTEILLFVLFGGLAGLLGLGAAYAVLRTTSLPEMEKPGDVRRFVLRHPRLSRRAILTLAAVVPAWRIGSAASGRWQTWQLWRHATPWGTTDPTYHRDLSYYVEVYPLHRMVASLTSHAVWWALVVAVLTSLVHGGIRLLGSPRGVTRGTVTVLSALLAPWLVLHAAQLWLDRAATVVSHRSVVTGPSYTDLHAVDPAKLFLAVVSVAVAGFLLLTARRGRLRFLALSLAIVVVASLGVGSAWPAMVMRLRERPSAASLDLPLIRQNIKATSDAFGITGDLTTVPAASSAALHGTALADQAKHGLQVRVLDPNRLSPTFNVKQQLQAYYRFKSTLDVDRYPLGSGAPTDVAIAVRELSPRKVALGSWANRHLVYTHGYGVVAAPTDSLSTRSDVPKFVDATTTDQPSLKVTQPDVYFGQAPMPWSIVGDPHGSHEHTEFDHPALAGGDATGPSYTTYDGGGGVPMGSPFRRLVYAAALHSPNVLFSGQVGSGSRILTVRNPSARVAAVAPWLTLDGDVYPAVVDGHVDWVVDGYTTSSTYPGSQTVDLHQATRSTLTQQGSNTAQPHRSVNYLRNSVKAVVDAYTGKVSLYEWDQSARPDPLLRTWESVFPGLVQPQASMPAALVQHVRYPQDLFDVQRLLLTRYHVQDAAGFYSGNDFWKVPTDPTVAATQALNAAKPGPLSPSTAGTPPLPSTYMSMAPTGTGAQTFALSSPLVTLNRRDLAGFLTVDAQPGPGYGRLTLLDFPAGGSAASPGEVQNEIESDTRISEALTLQRGGNSRVVLGNLLTIPLGDRMLYVEPVYTQAQGGDSFPILRHVVAIYGDGSPAFTRELPSALHRALSRS